MEAIERERVTTLKEIEKEKAVEIEKKNIQDVIKERVAVEKTVVIEQQKILDTEAFAGADREKQVAVTLAEKEAQELMTKQVQAAEAQRESARLRAEEEAFNVTKSAEAKKQAAEMHAEELGDRGRGVPGGIREGGGREEADGGCDGERVCGGRAR